MGELRPHLAWVRAPAGALEPGCSGKSETSTSQDRALRERQSDPTWPPTATFTTCQKTFMGREEQPQHNDDVRYKSSMLLQRRESISSELLWEKKITKYIQRQII